MTETAIVEYRTAQELRTIAKGTDVPTTLTEMQALARLLHTSKMLPTHLMNDEASIMLVMFACNSLDIPLWAGIQGIVVIEKKTGLSAQMIQALVLRAGFGMFPVQEECTNDVAVVRCVRPGIGADGGNTTLVKFTIEDAIQAKLVDKRPDGTLYARSKDGKALPWEKYGNQMLVWRAMSKAGRNYYPDILWGMSYIPEELGGDIDEDGNPVGRESTRIEVSPAVAEFALQILNADTHGELREVWQRIRAADLLDATNLRGESLDQLLRQRSETIRIRTGETTPGAGAPNPEKAETAPEEPAKEPEGDAEPAAEPEQPAAEEPADDVKAEPDPEDSRVEDDEREALCDILADVHPDGWPGVEADVLEQRGLQPQDVATAWLEDYAKRLQGKGE